MLGANSTPLFFPVCLVLILLPFCSQCAWYWLCWAGSSPRWTPAWPRRRRTRPSTRIGSNRSHVMVSNTGSSPPSLSPTESYSPGAIIPLSFFKTWPFPTPWFFLSFPVLHLLPWTVYTCFPISSSGTFLFLTTSPGPWILFCFLFPPPLLLSASFPGSSCDPPLPPPFYLPPVCLSI